ncbi:heterogeneous nuclear ribonucleoprotein Q-like [Diadema setosum]|uniref:heterogeneous nuclear ribonucleoprotein Q-like n=1 Tax=Diadema setosum TaxID=31175 RepID=UPI003B3BD45A
MADNGDMKQEEMEQQAQDAGGDEPMETEVEGRTDKYDSFQGMGFSEKVAAELDKFFVKGILADEELDERAIDALRELDENSRLGVLKQFGESDLSHVNNKSAFLCGVIKTYRQKSKMKQPQGGGEAKGPDEAKIKEILARTGYSLDVTTGQRKYSRPTPEDAESLPAPPPGSEIFIGKIPKEMYEDELIPLLEQCGEIHDLRLMMDPLSGLNRGYAFAAFTGVDGAREAVKQLNGHKIKDNWQLSVNVSVPKSRLYVGSIPKTKTKEEILEEFDKVEKGLVDVIIYHTEDKKRNRGFAFLEYDSHRAAASAKRKLSSGRTKVWNQVNFTVDWADPIIEPDSETMSKVKVVYIRNLSQESTEAKIKEDFGQYGEVEKAKKMKDYCFVHFKERESAMKAIEEMNGKEYEGSCIEVSLAKPPMENKKKKERIMRQQQSYPHFGYDGYSPRGRGGGPPMHGRGGPGGYGGDRFGRGDFFRFDDGYYGYEYQGGYMDYDDYYGGGFDYDQGYYGRMGRGMPRGRPRGRGIGMRGGPGAQRGFRGGGVRGGPRGGRGGPRGGRGNRGGRGGRGGNMGGKRKLEGQPMGDPKRRNTQSQWGTQPIAQQPLDQGYGYDYNSSYNDNWASDNFGSSHWK